MSALSFDFNIFNLARESYRSKNYLESFLILDSIPGFDSSLLKEETELNTGNSKFLNNLLKNCSGILSGVFDCPYHPYLSIEYLKYEEVCPTIAIDSRFINIKCVKQIEATTGLSNEQVVAVFPENFKSIIASDEHPVFYFVNKFAVRHLKYTRPFLEKFKFEVFFQPLNFLTEQKISELVANWVNIHEASHRTGVMPLPGFLFEKSNRYTAALEELRADLYTINKCFSQSLDVKHDEYLTGLYVLSERLLAYPLFRSKTNFDAISSIIMWKFLEEENVFKSDMDILKVKNSIDRLIQFISELEEKASTHLTPESRRAELSSLILEFVGDYENEFNKYVRYWGL